VLQTHQMRSLLIMLALSTQAAAARPALRSVQRLGRTFSSRTAALLATQQQQGAHPFPFRDDLLVGQKAVVTGGNDGIGVSISTALVKAGAVVAIVARSIEKYEALLRSQDILTEANTAFFAADLGDAAQTTSAAQEAVSVCMCRERGEFDVLSARRVRAHL
jgi:short chain dehydrogenase